MSDFYKKLIQIQSTLNAPKNQFNSFGKYKYRSQEDILLALKPLLAQHGLFQHISDKIVSIDGRFYVEATVMVTDGENSLTNVSYAREDESKKGMDGSQVTGASSSYARKYALNGMWGIDDSKDADSDEFTNQNNRNQNQGKQKQKPQVISQQQIGELQNMIESKGFTVEQACGVWKIGSLAQIPAGEFMNVKQAVEAWNNG